MRTSSTTILAILATCVVGCGAPESDWDGSIDDSGESWVVVNPTRALAETDDVRVERLWTYAGPDEGAIWEEPSRVRVDGSRVFIVDPPASRVHLIGVDGTPVSVIGSPGEGPGEYGRLVDVIPSSAGIFVLDGGNARLDLLNDDLDLVSSYPTGRLGFAAVPWGGDAVLVFGLLGSSAAWQRFDAEGPGDVIEVPTMTSELVDSDAPCTRTSSHRSGWILAQCAFPHVRIYGADGGVLEDLSVPFAPSMVTDEELEGLVRTIRETMGGVGMPTALVEQQVERARNRSRIKPVVRKVVVDDDGGLIAFWEQNPEDYGSGPATLHLLTRTGIYLETINFDSAWTDFELVDGVLYRMTRDPLTDLVTLAADRVTVSASLLAHASRAAEPGAP